jgi:chemotaxis response regulator CheB
MTIAQDEETSVVWGMPGAAVKIDAVKKILPLQEIAPSIVMEY